MDLTIANMKVGDKLLLGRYGAANSDSVPIVWLKADREGSFLSEKVLDYVMFDAPELATGGFYGRMGNNSYELSNIRQFLNSFEEDWYIPTHEKDKPPVSRNGFSFSGGAYEKHDGFLCAFEDYEIEAIGGTVNLPTCANMFGQGGQSRFELFKRKGIRPRPTANFVYASGSGWYDIEENSYCEVWLSDPDGEAYAMYIDRAGYKRSTRPDYVKGLRPVCKLSLNTPITLNLDGMYSIIPFEPTKKRYSNLCTDEELMAFMGLPV